MVNIIFPDGTTLATVIANLNVFTSNPGTSKGEGEIIYNSTTNKPYVNIGTAGSPNWSDISGSGGVTDHGGLTGLADDDHTQYYNSARHTTVLHNNLSIDHGSLGGKGDDDHTQYLLANGNRNITGDIRMVGGNSYELTDPSVTNIFSIKASGNYLYIDGSDGVQSLLDINGSTLKTTLYGALDINGKITGVSTPTLNTDAATKLYVDDNTGTVHIDTVNLPLSFSAGNLGLNWGNSLSLSGNDLVVNPANVDHGALGGLAGDDHTQYLLVNGSRAMTADLNMGGFDVTNALGLIGRSNASMSIVGVLGDLTLSTAVGSNIKALNVLNMDSNKIVGLATPTLIADAATKAYVDDAPSSDGVYVCTSSTRPTATEGRTIYETDTDKILVFIQQDFTNAPLNLISGEYYGAFTGFYWTGSTWVTDSNIVSGLGDIGGRSSPAIFLDNYVWKLIAGEYDGVFNGFYWTGSTWVTDSNIVSGLGDIGGYSSPAIFLDGSTWKLIAGEDDGVFNGFYWTGSTWTEDSSIVSGLPDVGTRSASCIFLDSSTWKLISGNYDGTFQGFYWTGSTWTEDSSIVSGLPDVGLISSPAIFLDGSTWKIIIGEYDGVFNGFYWTGSTWTEDSSIVSGLPDVGTYSSPFVFFNGFWKDISTWVGIAASNLDMNGYDILDGSLGANLDMNTYGLTNAKLASNLDINDYDLTNADTIQAKSTNSLTFKVSTGKSFIFQKV